MTTKAATNRRLTRYVAGPALALGLAIGSAAVANAVWDIGEYDNCLAEMPRDLSPDGMEAWVEGCCARSGGDWKYPKGCFATPLEAGRVPTHVMQPLPLPGQGPDIGPATGGVG